MPLHLILETNSRLLQRGLCLSQLRGEFLVGGVEFRHLRLKLSPLIFQLRLLLLILQLQAISLLLELHCCGPLLGLLGIDTFMECLDLLLRSG